MNVDYLDPAKAELLETIAYYNQQSEGLGYEFAGEVARALARIIQFPDAWAKLSEHTRRCRTNRFPYGIIYQVRGDEILVIAVMHLSRHPDSWKGRLT